MLSWYYFSQDDIDYANDTINFLESKIKKINECDNISEDIKTQKIKRINLSINCIKYYYGI